MPTKAKPQKPVPEILSQSEKTSLQEEKKELENTLTQTEDYGRGTTAEILDKSALRRQIQRIDEAIDMREAPKVSGKKKDTYVREARELEERFKQGLPTKYEMAHPAKCPGAIRKHMAWLQRNEKYVDRYRYVQRIINPDDPQSIETLRKEK